jgi:hypothetical protein
MKMSPLCQLPVTLPRGILGVSGVTVRLMSCGELTLGSAAGLGSTAANAAAQPPCLETPGTTAESRKSTPASKSNHLS